MTKQCPVCGRMVNTHTNKLGIEVWNRHMWGTWSDRTIDYKDDLKREPGRHDNEVPCDNSGQPVEK